jgi:hypothetical protein
MRTYGRVSDVNGNRTWVVVMTDGNGFNDLVWITTLAQCLYLSPGESPFYANYGIPAVASVLTQVFPDFYVNRTQGQFASKFASLIIQRQPIVQSSTLQAPVPTYNIGVVTHAGAQLPPITIPTSIPV